MTLCFFRLRAFCGVKIVSKKTRNKFVNTTDKLYNIAKIKPYNKAEKEDVAIVSKSNMII